MDVKDMISKMTLKEKASLLSGSDFWHTEAVERLDLPGFMMCDGPNGLRKQKGESDHLGVHDSIETVCYPTASSLSASFDTELVKELGETLGEECLREEVSMLLGPGLNMKRSPICGRNFEYYSEDPYLAGKLAASYIKGIQSKGILACPKHFAANNQEYRRMSGSSNLSERTLHEIYLAAFEMMVKEAKPKAIMCSYNKINGTYLSENRYMLTEVLRDKWGFDGFVVTDWGAGKDPAKGVEAGLDLVMPGPRPDHEKAIIAAALEGKLSEDKVDEAVSRILTSLNFYIENRPSNVSPSDDSTRKQGYELARRIAENSAVLLKNDKVLPLKEGKKILFVGEFAKDPRYQGSGSSHVHSSFVSNAYDCAKDRGISYARGYDTTSPKESHILRQEAVEAAENADVIVIFAGLPGSYESEGFDRNDINLPPEQDKLIAELSQLGKKTVVVMHNGAPVAMPWIDKVDAVLDMFLAGDAVGEATVRLLFGEVNPSGKLSESYPLKLSDNPSFLNFPGDAGNPNYAEGIFIGYRYYEKKRMSVLFPFGHGLSYTDFEYLDASADKKAITDEETLTVSLEIWNVGRYKGKEAVQLYVSSNNSRVARPLKELKGFTKIELEPGEKKKVSFTLDKRSFAYYSEEIHDFFVESGDYTIMIGSSSSDIRQTVTVHVEGTKELPVEINLFTPIADILETKKGKEILSPLLEEALKGQGDGAGDAMGAGAAKMMRNMILEMPLGGISGFGLVSENEFNDLVEALTK